MNQILIIASYLFMIGGLINGSTEVDNPESKIIYLLNGNKISVHKNNYSRVDRLCITSNSIILIIVLFLLLRRD